MSAVDEIKAQEIMRKIKEKDEVFAARRFDGYLERRRELEKTAREIFTSKGGKPEKEYPHYMVIEECNWLESWYKQNDYVKIPIPTVKTEHVSFSYGDLFPTFSDRVNDGKEYRKQVYTFDEIMILTKKYGLPQTWNPDGKYGPERYIEVHVWSDEFLKQINDICK